MNHLARDLDRTAVRPRLAADQAEQCRFPRAACAQDRDELAARNPQAQALEDLPRTVREFDAGDLDEVFGGGVHFGRHSACSSATVPSPPSAQMLTTARLPPGIAASSFTACERMRAPVAPNGWPSATEPPWGLSRSHGNLPRFASTPAFSRRKLALSNAATLHSTCAANASWISHSAMSPWVRPFRASMRGIAYAGAMSNPSVKTFTAAISQSRRRARGMEPGKRLIPAPVATHRPAAPSVRGDAFPAVIVPLPLFLSKAGCSFARRSRLVSARGKP